MEYRRFKDTLFIRLDKGEEILEQLEKVCTAERVKLAQVSAIGAINEFTVGVLRTAEKQYKANNFTGDHEIVSLTGTVTTKEGAFYAHLHLAAGDETGAVVGGHLNRAVVSATCEMVVRVVDGTVERRFSDEIGLNLFEFV